MKRRQRILIALLFVVSIAAIVASILVRRNPTAPVFKRDSLVVFADRTAGLTFIALDDTKPTSLYILKLPHELLILTVGYDKPEWLDDPSGPRVYLTTKLMGGKPQYWHWRVFLPHKVFLTSSNGPIRFAIYIPLWHFALWPLVIVAAIFWRARRRRKRKHCQQCDYNLAGLPPGTICPECGGLPVVTSAPTVPRS